MFVADMEALEKRLQNLYEIVEIEDTRKLLEKDGGALTEHEEETVSRSIGKRGQSIASIFKDGGNQDPLGIKDILLSRGFNLQEAEVILEEVQYIVDRLKLKISAKEREEIVLKFKRFTVWDFIKTNKRMFIMHYLRWFGFALFARIFIAHKDISILLAMVSSIFISILYYKTVVYNFRRLSGDLSEGRGKKLADLSRVKILCKSGVHIDLFRETVAHELVHYLGTVGFIKLDLYLASAIGEYRIRELNKETEFSRGYNQYYLKGLELADKDGMEFQEKEANEFCGIRGFKERSMKIKYVYQCILDRLDFVGDGWKAYAYGTLISGIARKIAGAELDSQKGWEYLRLRAMMKEYAINSQNKRNNPIFQDGGKYYLSKNGIKCYFTYFDDEIENNSFKKENILKQIKEINRSIGWEKYNIDTEVDFLKGYTTRILVKKSDGKIIGYLIMNMKGYITFMTVKHEYQMQGIGKKLFYEAVLEAQKGGLGFVSLHYPANGEQKGFYEKLFKEFQIIKKAEEANFYLNKYSAQYVVLDISKFRLRGIKETVSRSIGKRGQLSAPILKDGGAAVIGEDLGRKRGMIKAYNTKITEELSKAIEEAAEKLAKVEIKKAGIFEKVPVTRSFLRKNSEWNRNKGKWLNDVIGAQEQILNIAVAKQEEDNPDNYYDNQVALAAENMVKAMLLFFPGYFERVYGNVSVKAQESVKANLDFYLRLIVAEGDNYAELAINGFKDNGEHLQLLQKSTEIYGSLLRELEKESGNIFEVKVFAQVFLHINKVNEQENNKLFYENISGGEKDGGVVTRQIKALAYWMAMSIAVSSILFGPAIMFASVAGYTESISSLDKLILLFEYILLIVTGIIGIGFVVRWLYRFNKAKMVAEVDRNVNQDDRLGDIEKLASKINEDTVDKETKAALGWKSKVKEFILKIPYVILSMALLFGSSYALAFLYGYGLSPWVLNAVIFIGGAGVLIGLFYSVENIRALSGQGRAGFSFGLDKEQIKTLEPKERLALIQLADQLYFRNQVQKIQPSFIGAIRNLGTFKGIMLMAAGALIAYSFPGIDNWYILAGAIFGLILPYLVSVTYNFFCSYMNHYKFRSEFAKEYLKNEKAQEELRGKAGQLVSGNKFLFPFKNLWYGFSLRFPIAGSIIIFALARGQMIFWGAVVSSALMPFIGLNTAGISIFEVAMYFFNILGIREGFEFSLNLMNIFNDWHLLHTFGDFFRLAIIAYGLSVPFLFNQMIRRPWHSPGFLIKWIFAPLVPYVTKGNFSRFWTSFFHLWIIDFEIGAVLRGAGVLAQHPQLDNIGKPLNNVVQSLEGRWGVIGWGGYGLDAVTQVTGINFSQGLHNILGGKEDVNVWNNAYFLYRVMKFDPSVIGRMQISEPELELLLKEFKNKDMGFNIFNIPERNRWVRQYSAFLLGEKGTEQAQEILIRALNDGEDIVGQRAAAASLGKFADYKAVEPLINNLQADSSEENIMALMAIDDPRAARFFIQGLQNNEKIVRTVSALWLGQHGDPQIASALIQALRQDKGWRFEIPNLDEDKSIEAIKNMSPAYAEAIVLAQINDPNSIEPLLKIASSSVSRQVTEFSFDLLEDYQSSKKDFEEIENKASSWNCLMADKRALGLLQRIQANKQLLWIGKDNNFIPISREAAMLILKAEKDLQNNQLLLETTIDKWPFLEIEKDRKALSACKEASAISLNLLEDLENIKSEFNFIKNDGLYSSSIQAAMVALGLLQDSRAINPLMGAALEVPSADIRKTAAYALGNFNAPEVENTLERMLKDRDANVRSTAAVSLAKVREMSKEEVSEPVKDKGKVSETGTAGDKDGTKIEYSFTILKTGLKDERPEMRYAALNLFTDQLADPIIREAFIDRLKYDNEPSVRRQAAISLAGIDDSEVRDVLKSALNDPYPQVKAAAILSLTPKADYATMETIKPFLDDPNLEVSRAAVLSMGARLPDFSKNIDYLLPKLNSDKWQIRQATLYTLGENINKFPQLKDPFLKIAKDNTQPLIFQQSALASLSQINEPEIKDLLVSKLNHPDWRMRQTSAFGLGNFKDTDIIPSLKPLLNDRQWQVRQATVGSLGNFNNPQTIDYLIPKLKDPSWQVRQATILPLASNLKAFPGLEQPLMNTFQDKSEDLWMRQIAGASLKNAGYSVGFDLEGIKPLEKSFVVSVSGVGDALGFNFLTDRNDPGWSRRTVLGQDFSRLEAMGTAKMFEYDWSGNLDDTRIFNSEQNRFKMSGDNIRDGAKAFGAQNIVFLLDSEGNNVAYLGIQDIIEKTKDQGLKINIISIGSPSPWATSGFSKLADLKNNPDGRIKFQNFADIKDPISWLSMPFLNSDTRYISASPIHAGYSSNLDVRQTVLSRSTGMDIPITYSRMAYGSISDQYFSATYKIQQMKSVYPSGITSYQTKEWYTYRSGQELIPSNLYNTINPLPPMRTNLPSMPRVPSGGGIGGGAGIGRGRI
ncbi:MAG: GNAT family N-acetyltransferase [Candidatus Omnitrophota bacterium]|nr:GNAT family N-acetyltransferase [Candidatus Omnitrophota bacterium]